LHPSREWTLKLFGTYRKNFGKEFERKRLDTETQSQLSPSRFNGGDCKVTQVMYDTSLASLKHSHRLKYKLADVSAGKLSTPETWARDTGLVR